METNGIVKEPRDMGAIPIPATQKFNGFIMIKSTKKFLSQELRKKGFSIGEIAQKLKMQKSGSISNWCRDIVLSSWQIERLLKKQRLASYAGRMKFLEKTRKARIIETEFLRKEGLKEVSSLSNRDLFIGGIGLYWGEGYKYSGGEQVGFTNSDPRIILFMLRWFKEICGIAEDRFSLQIKINIIHKKRIKELENYWSKTTGVSLSQFNKTVLIRAKSKKVYPDSKKYYGTLRITIRRSAQLRRKINGWIEGLGVNTV